MTRTLIYVGLSTDGSREVFRANETPTPQSHGERFAAVIGPFRTKAGAEFMRNYGRGNPHCQTVTDAERLARHISVGEATEITPELIQP